MEDGGFFVLRTAKIEEGSSPLRTRNIEEFPPYSKNPSSPKKEEL